jgi:hypothetical protein
VNPTGDPHGLFDPIAQNPPAQPQGMDVDPGPERQPANGPAPERPTSERSLDSGAAITTADPAIPVNAAQPPQPAPGGNGTVNPLHLSINPTAIHSSPQGYSSNENIIPGSAISPS